MKHEGAFAKKQRYAVLLRGINVGGNKKVPMVRLREILTQAGFDDVASYIQSGNIVLSSTMTAPKVEEKVASLITDEFGFDVAVMVRSSADVAKTLADNPYPDGDAAQTAIWFTTTAIPASQREAAKQVVPAGRERFMITSKEIYVDFGGRMSDSKLSDQLLKLIKVEVTARNLRTVAKLVEMLDDH